ncbi:OmpH family outer membrane protein [Tamlana fucoidanivorans]|uniref:OmpH family outer membrane protein n=1 Tax=Allotamlana fucoidanivorans TaxID=2583814 RepID=A0A5C4SS06_9FLAO|nr:OmpH family outer membrane protein [Tamlana fucoidanivorans]TNJ47062.1 OmpH family outer membrane protein [Tamlana fucoidanivorans]
MKHIFYVVVVSLVFVSCQQNKIGFIDNGTVINGFQKKKDVEAKFQSKEEAFRKKADSISKAFELEVKETQTTARKSSQVKAQELMSGLQQKQQMLQQQMQFEQQQLTQAFQAEIDSVIVDVKAFVKEYGKKNGYNFVFGTSENAASVLYGEEQADLTEIILNALNEDYNKE